MRRSVQFYSGGLKIEGELFVPESHSSGKRMPGVVICHGFSQHKEIFGLSYAESLSRHGYVCLSFDYRGFGGSEGQRGQLIPLNEVEDARSALTFLSVQPEVDRERLGLLGTSFGGAVVLHVGAIDERAKAIVCFDGIGSGRRWLRNLRRHREWIEFIGLLEQERINRVLTGKSEYVEYSVINPYADHPGLKSAHEERRRQFPGWQSELTLETAQAVIEFVPEEMASLISPRALLVIYDSNPRSFAVEEAKCIYAKAREPRGIASIPDTARQYGHYFGEELEHWISLSADWYQRYL